MKTLKTHYIDDFGQVQQGTAQVPANNGIYLVVLDDGKTSVEPYTVAFGWNNYPVWRIALSSYLKPLPTL